MAFAEPMESFEFEFRAFRREDHAPMLAADDSISGGKLVPHRLLTARRKEKQKPPPIRVAEEVHLQPFVAAPRSSTCSVRWRNLMLRLRRWNLDGRTEFSSSSLPPGTTRRKPANLLLRRYSKSSNSSIDPVIDLPLLHGCNSEPLGFFCTNSGGISRSASSSTSASSSSSVDLEERISQISIRQARKVSKEDDAIQRPARSVNSPRLTAAGKVVFYDDIERRSSRRSGGNCDPAARCPVAAVHVTPVINVIPSSVFAIGRPGGTRRRGKEEKEHENDGNMQNLI